MKNVLFPLLLITLISGCAHGAKKAKTPEQLAKDEKHRSVLRHIVGSAGAGMSTMGQSMAPRRQATLLCDPVANLDGTHTCHVQN